VNGYVGDCSLGFLVEMTGEPTGIRLMLPARTRLVENEAFFPAAARELMKRRTR